MKNYILINTIELFQEALLHIQQNEFIAYDTESTGLNVRKDKVIGFGFTGVIGTGYYFPLLKWEKWSIILKPAQFDDFGNCIEDAVVEHKEALVDCALPFNYKLLLDALKQKKLIMHNASYDIRITMNDLGTNYLGALHADTQLMEHTLDEESETALKKLAEKYKVEIGLDEQDASNQEQLELAESVKRNGGKWLKTQKDIYKGDMELIGYYCIADCDMTLRLFNSLENRLLKERLHDFFYVHEVMELYKHVTIKMEHRGVYNDMQKVHEFNTKILADLKNCEFIVIEALMATPAGQRFVEERLHQEFAPKNSGTFAQKICSYYKLDLPLTAAGKFSITKKTVTAAMSLYEDKLGENAMKLNACCFLQTGDVGFLVDGCVPAIQLQLLKESDNSENFINIGSKHHLGKIVFDFMNISSLTKTAKGAPQFNEDFVEHIAEKYGFDWAKELRVYNKLTKIQGSYYQRFLDQNEDGIFYPTFKQHATTSGRYGSDLQQLSRPKEDDGVEDPRIIYYTNVIRELIIPKPGYIFIDNDYESLEPRVFCDDAEDQPLMDIFFNKEDFYSKVAIMALGLTDVSADKKAVNFLKNKYPHHRQNAKAYALGIRFGAKEGKVSQLLSIDKEEASELIDNYFKAFPNLKKKMDHYLREAKTTGKVTSKFGRVRHLPRVKEIYDTFGDGILDYKKLGTLAKRHGITYNEIKDIRKQYNGLLNNALNFPIQSAATSIISRAAIAMAKEFKEKNLDAWVSLSIHDQLVISAKEEQKHEVSEIVQRCMETTNTLIVPLVAVPQFAHNLREGH